MKTALTLRPQESPVQAASDSQTVALWLKGKAQTTQAAYRRDLSTFAAFVDGKGLTSVTLADLYAFAESLTGSPATQRRTLAAIKSLFRFAARIGYIRFDPGSAVKLPALKNELAARILPEASVQRILAMDSDKISPRNSVILRLLYVGGLRASEIASLTWKDIQENGNACQVTVYGKGGKTRVVLLTETMWKALQGLRNGAGSDSPVFPSRIKKPYGEFTNKSERKGTQRGETGHMSAVQIFRIVQAAAKVAGIEGNVSPHWLRHCHASHALDHGAPVSLVQSTLGHASVATTSRYLHARPDCSSATFILA